MHAYNLQLVCYCLFSSYPSVRSVRKGKIFIPFSTAECLAEGFVCFPLNFLYHFCTHFCPEDSHSQQPALASPFGGLPPWLMKARWIYLQRSTENWRLGMCIAQANHQEMGCMHAQSFQLSLTLCNPMDFVARQATLSMGFPRQENWSRLPFPPPGDLPNWVIKPTSPALLAILYGWGIKEEVG